MKLILSKAGVRLCTGFKRLGVGFSFGFCKEAMNLRFPSNFSTTTIIFFRQSYAKFTLRVAPFLGHCLPIILCRSLYLTFPCRAWCPVNSKRLIVSS